MIRKKKKRLAVPIKNPFQELGLPFEGRRMLIRPEDIQEKHDRSSTSKISIAKKSISAAARDSGMPCFNSEIKSSTSNATGTENDRLSHGDEKQDWKEMSCDCSGGCDTCPECPPLTRVKYNNKTKADKSFVITHENSSRMRKNCSKKMCDVNRHYDVDLVESYAAQSCASYTKDNPHKYTDEMRQRSEGNQIRDNVLLSLTDGNHSINTRKTDETKLKSACFRQSSNIDAVKPVPHIMARFRNNVGQNTRKEREKCVACKTESFHKAASSGSRIKIIKPEDIQEDHSNESRTNQIYHVRREKHCRDNDDEQDYSYVIRVDCESSVDNSFNNVKRTQTFTKVRRGDITRIKKVAKDISLNEAFIEQKKPIDEEMPNELESSCLPEVPYPSNESTRSGKIRESSQVATENWHKQQCVSKTSCSKSKVAGRLIDHLERKESLYDTSTSDLLSNISTDTLEDTVKRNWASQELMRTWKKVHPVQQNVAVDKKFKTVLPEAKQKCTFESDAPLNATEKSDVSVNSTSDSDVSNSQGTLLATEEQFNDVALANMNDNKKHKRGIPRSKIQSPECGKPGESPLKYGQREESRAANLKYKPSKEISMKKENGFLKSSNEGNCNATFEYDLSGLHRKNNARDRARWRNFSNTPQNNDVVASESCIQNQQTPVTIKRVLKPGVVHLTECASKSGLKFAPLYTEANPEHLSDSSSEENCLSRSENHGSSISYTKSPRSSSLKTRSLAVSLAQSRNKSPPLPTGLNGTQKCASQSPRLRGDADRKASAALPQMLESPSCKPPATSLILQNECHSHRMTTNCACELRPECRNTNNARRSQSPLPIARSVVDSTGVATLNELNMILEEARVNSLSSCEVGDSNTSAINISCANSKSNKCVGPSFIGEYLRSLWQHQTLCDTRVTVGTEEFLVHKIVLAAYSSVFCPATTKPEPTVCFSIPNSSPDAVRQIFSYMYTATMALTDDLLEPVLNAAQFLGVQEVVDIVKDILAHPTLDNITRYNSIIRRQGLRITLLDQESLYREAFTDIKGNVAFLGLSLREFLSILKDPEVLVSDEAETLEVIVSWVEYNYLQRIPNLTTLLDQVSFETISPNKLAEIAAKYSHIFDTPAGNSFLCEAFKFHALRRRSTCRPESQLHVFKAIKDSSCSPRCDLILSPAMNKITCPEIATFTETREMGEQTCLEDECEPGDLCQNERPDDQPAFSSRLSPNSVWRIQADAEAARCKSPTGGTSPNPDSGLTTPLQWGQTRINSNKGRTGRVSFHSSIGENSPQSPTNQQLLLNNEMLRDTSRNNNAFDEMFIHKLNCNTNKKRPNELVSNHLENPEPFSKSSKKNSGIYAKMKNIQIGFRYIPDAAQHRQETMNVNLANIGKSNKSLRIIPKSMSVQNNYSTDKIVSNVENETRRIDRETHELLNQMYIDKMSLSNVHMNVNSNEASYRKYRNQEMNNTSDVSCSKDGMTHNVFNDRMTTCTRPYTPSVVNNIRGGGKKMIEKKGSEESLMILGHDADASAFRVYKPP